MTSLSRRIKRVRPLLGTWVDIELTGHLPETTIQRCITRGFRAIQTVDRLMNRHRPTSDISRLNRAPMGRWLTVDVLTRSVLAAALKLYDQSDGLFDVRLESNSKERPLEIRGRRVRKMGSWSFDLGGIAKGFAVDYAYRCMRRGAGGRRMSGVINAGGDLRLWGQDDFPASIQIMTPTSPLVKTFRTGPGAIATSSARTAARKDYATVRYTKTSKEKTATVFAGECLWADGLTKIVLLGSSQTAKRCLALYAARAIVHTPDGKIAEVFN